jgi:methionine aminotransferase
MARDMKARIDIPSRLPDVGTTIFTVMSALAQEHLAINLGQGFPDFDCDPALIAAVDEAMRSGANQYPPMAGWPALRQAVAGKIAALYGRSYDWQDEITITAGATQAILTAVLSVVQPGDEVIVLEPCYDSYVPNIQLAGGIPIYVPLDMRTYLPDFGAIQRAVTPRTRALLLNTPHNPSGRVWSEAQMRELAALLDGTPVVVIADEVYEHMVFDGAKHQSVARFAPLAERSIVISSFGKTFHVTGWKVGYAAAPAALMREFRKVHQFNVFTVNTPMQAGLAQYLRDPRPYLELPAFYERKRNLFRDALAATRLALLPCEGSYFQCADYAAVSDLPAQAFCEWLTREVGVAAIPLAAFYREDPRQTIIRFCFAKRDETLRAAAERLQAL